MWKLICWIIVLFTIDDSQDTALAKQDECGQLEITSPRIVGANVTFLFTPVASKGSQSGRVVWKKGWPEGWSIVKGSSRFIQFQRNGTFVLVLLGASLSKDNDVYFMVDYESTGGNMCHSNTVLLVLFDGPDFKERRSVDGCENCLLRYLGRTSRISCKVMYDTPEVTVSMKLDNDTLSTKIRKHEYLTDLEITEKHHMATIKCSAIYGNTTVPVVVTARLYVIRVPDTPVLEIPRDLRQGRSEKITCSVTGARPAPELVINVNDTKVETKSTFSMDNRCTFGVFTSLAEIMREWNGLKIFCCLRSNDYWSKKCSPGQILQYKFTPKRVLLRLPTMRSERQFYSINAYCLISEANPKCVVTWYTLGKILIENYSLNSSESRRHETEIGDMTEFKSVYMTLLNVTERENGQMVTCVVRCPDFNTSFSDSAKIWLPSSPVILINLTTSSIHVTDGSEIYIRCFTHIPPVSSISWFETINGSAKLYKNCQAVSECIMKLFGSSDLYLRQFTCQVRHDVLGTFEKSISVKTSGPMRNEEVVPGLAIILSSASVIVSLILIVVLSIQIRKLYRKKTRTCITEGRTVQKQSQMYSDKRLFLPTSNQETGHPLNRSENGDNTVNIQLMSAELTKGTLQRKQSLACNDDEKANKETYLELHIYSRSPSLF